MSFIDQLMAVRGLNVKDRLFDRMTTPPINANPNISTLPDGGYGANTSNPLLQGASALRNVDVGLMGKNILNAVSRARDALATPSGFEAAGKRAAAPTYATDWYTGKPGVTKDLLNAISGHEVRGQRANAESIWLRTTAHPKDSKNPEYKRKGSTAYGPLQITKSTLADIDTKNLSASEQKTYDKLMLQGELFKHFGNEGPGTKGYAKRGNKVPKPYKDTKTGKTYVYDKKWDYGGLGISLTQDDKKNYWEFGKKLLEKKAGYMKKGSRLPRKYNIEDMTPADIARLARAWRGEDKGFGTTTASKYEKDVMARYNNRAKLRGIR